MNGSIQGPAYPEASAEEIRGELTPSEAKPVNVLHLLHSVLRGRYWLASVLALLGLAAGAVVGHRIPKPEYESAGLIRIKPNLPKILYQNEQNSSVMPMFDAYVDSQVALIKSQRVTDLAMQDPAWTSLHRGLSQENVVAFTGALTVTHPKSSELIIVAFDDADPDAARIAVGAVIDAYQHLYGENDTESASQRLQVLEDRRTSLSNELKGLNDRVLQIANDYGSNTLDRLYQFKLDELNTLEAQLRKAELATAAARSGGALPTTAPSAVMTEVLAIKSPEIRELLSSKRQLERKLAGDTLRLGTGNPAVIETKTALDTVNRQIEELSEAYRKLGPDALNSSGASAALNAPKTLEHVQAEEKNIRELYDRAKAETVEMGRKCVEITSLQNDIETVKTRLDETKQRIEQINVESSVGGRVTVESRGDRPLSPVKDKRLAAAAGGGAGMAALGIATVLLYGWLNRRVRHISDVRDGLRLANRILGVLPNLPDLADPEQAAIAAHSVHHIRASLQDRRRHGDKPVFVVTSPSPGAGKTNLVQALGLSFALSGSRTLLIDCDIVGGGLTAKMKTVMRRRLAHVLRRKGVINNEQFAAAIQSAKQSRRRMGEVLIDLGFANEEQVADALAAQLDTTVGLLEALNGDALGECIAETGTPGLFLMPLGSAERQHVGHLSYTGLRKIIEQARPWFDVIVIDTGPILGSLEASVAAMVADEVVLTVSRGEQHAMLERAIQYVDSTGATIAGIVLNRADNDDILSSGYSSSASRASVDKPSDRELTLSLAEHESLRLGPISSAVYALTESARGQRDR